VSADPVKTSNHAMQPRFTKSGRAKLHRGVDPDFRRAAIRRYDETGNVIETHEHSGDFEP
jgi:hypothetical protein